MIINYEQETKTNLLTNTASPYSDKCSGCIQKMFNLYVKNGQHEKVKKYMYAIGSTINLEQDHNFFSKIYTATKKKKMVNAL